MICTGTDLPGLVHMALSSLQATQVRKVSLDENNMAKMVKDILAISKLLNYLEDVWGLWRNYHFE